MSNFKRIVMSNVDVIEGNIDGATVLFNGVKLDPRESLKVRQHSPDGFSWGYAGSGPSQLALGILLAAKVPLHHAIWLYQEFKTDFLVRLNEDEGFTLRIGVYAWATQRLEQSNIRIDE